MNLGESSAPSTKPARNRRWLLRVRPRVAWALATLLVLFVCLFGLRAYPFLAVPTQRVPAEILVVEGWIYDYGFEAAAAEYRGASYDCVVAAGVSYFENGRHVSYAERAAQILAALRIPASRIVTCPGPATNWNRTSSSARAVRDQLAAQGIRYTGVNVVTIGPHARQSWLAYQRIMGPDVRVGIITVPKQGVDTDHWWTTAHGIKMVTKDFAGWLREWLFGPRG